MIELEGVSRAFAVGEATVLALREVTLTIAAGDYVSVMGPSGSGKSTLLNLVGCLDRPTAGSYRLDGVEVARMDDDALSAVRQRKIGFVFQTFHLVPRLTAHENVELPMVFAGVGRTERRERAAVALAEVGLGSRGTHRPEQLSGGERQRVAIARAVVMRPAIVLADEPTGNLDTRSGQEIVGLLERMHAGGLTLVLVTHDPSIGARARRWIQLVDGRVSADRVTGGPA